MEVMTDVEHAAEVLRGGGLVAFPTETVYGLGGDARNGEVIRRLFAAKGRPATNPLIVHVAGVVAAKRYVSRWPDYARVLAQRFWPGPLTLVMPKADVIADEVTAGGPTVGLRMPDHPLALAMLAAFDGPVAAPSANRSNRISPTTADHVRAELGEMVDFLLDGGPCAVGIESTVLDVIGPRPRLLRPGQITREQIEAVVGPIDVGGKSESPGIPLSSPGQLPVHYAPTAPAYRFETPDRPRLLARRTPADQFLLISLPDAPPIPNEAQIHTLPPSPVDYARQLYGTLRELDGLSPPAIYIEMPPDTPDWLAIRDRLTRATRPWTDLGPASA
jgi:L-threonylcarbamoyladenylate synthase